MVNYPDPACGKPVDSGVGRCLLYPGHTALPCTHVPTQHEVDVSHPFLADTLWTLPSGIRCCKRHIDGCPPDDPIGCDGPRRPHHLAPDADGQCPYCGTVVGSQPAPDVWTPGRRPPTGQYTVTVNITGDDLGPDALAWTVTRQLEALGLIATVTTVTPTGRH